MAEHTIHGGADGAVELTERSSSMVEAATMVMRARHLQAKMTASFYVPPLRSVVDGSPVAGGNCDAGCVFSGLLFREINIDAEKMVLRFFATGFQITTHDSRVLANDASPIDGGGIDGARVCEPPVKPSWEPSPSWNSWGPPAVGLAAGEILVHPIDVWALKDALASQHGPLGYSIKLSQAIEPGTIIILKNGFGPEKVSLPKTEIAQMTAALAQATGLHFLTIAKLDTGAEGIFQKTIDGPTKANK